MRFGPGGRFDLRPAEYRLLVDGQPTTLGGRALDLLIVLAARPAQLLTKNELLDRVWPGVIVEENNLRVQINALRRLLGEDAIATVPGRGYRFSLAVHAEAPPAAEPTAAPAPAAASLAHAPPQRLFGRDADLAQLERALNAGGAGLTLTLVGTSGVGKSSLARVALARWPGRSAWVDLAPLTQGSQVTGALARALGAQLDDSDPAPQLLRALPPGEALLLVLDNAEHLVETCAEWAQRLGGAPGLRLLVTSQLPLGLRGEQVQRLEPLPVTGGAEATDTRDGALALLIERITAADHRFQVTPAALPLLATLCQQLDGLPLALEMAAARVPLMGLRAVHDALAERFALLSRGRRDSPARHRTLHDALDWSYQLLGAPEQRLFRALGVFAGGFTLDLAVTLTADEHLGRWDIIDGLATLVERSLVSVSGEADPNAPPRYRLLETMRAYALEQLAKPAAAGSGTVDENEGLSLRRRHAAVVLALFVRPQANEQRLAEMENARAAFLWAREHDLAIAVPLSSRAADISSFTIWRQEVTEWMLSLAPAMRGAAGQALPLQTQAPWWSMMAFVLNVRRDPAARPAARQAVALWRELGNTGLEMLSALGHWVRAITESGPELDDACAQLQAACAANPIPRHRLLMNGALAEASRLRGDSLALLACREQELLMAHELAWSDMAQAAETNVCAALIDLGRHAEAAERGLALLARIDAAAGGGDANGNLPWALNALVESLAPLGRHAEAQAFVPRSIAASRRFGTTVAWQGILVLVAAQQRPVAAARLTGYVEQLWAATPGATPDRDERERLARVRGMVRQELGADTVAVLAAEGRYLGDEAAAALAAAAD